MASIRRAILLSVIVVSTEACGTASPGSVATMVAGWEQHFTLEWTTDRVPGDARQLRGYVYNRHGEYALNVRLLAQALDPSGAVVGQRIEWVPGGVNGFGRAYFEVAKLPVADHYRVTVWDCTWFQSNGDKRR